MRCWVNVDLGRVLSDILFNVKRFMLEISSIAPELDAGIVE